MRASSNLRCPLDPGRPPLAATWLAVLLWLLTAASASAAEAGGHGLLWRIEAAGHPPSYLLGTMHTPEAAVVLDRPAVQRVLGQVDRVLVEVATDDQTLMAMAQAMVRPQGPPLSELLGAADFARLASALEPYGMPAPVVEVLKPWAAATTLLTPPAPAGEVLDQRLQTLARERGIPVVGIETLDEQIDVFDGLSMQEQLGLLREVLDMHEDFRALLDKMRAAYLDGDLERLQRISEESMADADPEVRDYFEDRMIEARNRIMFERVRPVIDQVPVLIAVGALHLAGEDGLIERLRRAGYRVTPVQRSAGETRSGPQPASRQGRGSPAARGTSSASPRG